MPIEVLPWQSPTHSKDSTVQRLPWTYCENRDKVNDSQQRLRMVTPTIEGFHSCVDPLHLWLMIQGECEHYSLSNRDCYMDDFELELLYLLVAKRGFCVVMQFMKKPNGPSSQEDI